MKEQSAEKLETLQDEQEVKDTTTDAVNNTVSDDDDADLFACIKD